MNIPAGTDPTQVTGYQPPNWKAIMPPALQKSVRASQDPKEYSKYISEYAGPKLGADGTVTDMVGRPLMRPTKEGIIYFNPNGSTRFVPFDQAANTAEVQKAADMATAQEQAKAQYDMIKVPIGGGQERMMPRADAVAFLRQQQQPQAPSGNGTRFNLNLQNATPEEAARTIAYAQQDSASQPKGAQLGMGGVGVTPSPSAMEQSKSDIETAALQQRNFNAANITGGQKQLTELQAKRPVATAMLSGLDQLERMDQKGVFNGPAQNKYMGAAIWINSMFPGANLDVNKIGDSQAYDAALKQVARSGLKAFGGRVTNAEFGAVLSSLPERMATPEARAQMRTQMGAMAVDELNQVNSAERHWNPKTGMVGWNPPSPITPDQYWQTRSRVMNLQPAPNLNQTDKYHVQQVLKGGRPEELRQLILNGLLQ